jgi:glycerol-3-phosphate O-acyltransferase / dihydroxyacetone phosphate acyltransferase
VDPSATGLYQAARWLLELALGFYFRRIERFHPERVPAARPVLFVSNHPNSLTDSFLIGTSVARKVNFVATVQLFRAAPLKWLLTRCGVIPINRPRDDPRAMRSVAASFEACFRVLEDGQAVGIFPEGITYDDSQLKEIKTGAARLALELEHRHAGALGLQLVPVGLSYTAKEKYRSDVLIHFGHPVAVAEFLEGYPERRKECVTRLTGEIEHRLQQLILHLPGLEHQRIVAGVKRLYLDKLRVGNQISYEPVSPAAEELLLTQRIAAVVERAFETQPEAAAGFAARLHAYEHGLARLHVSDEQVAWSQGRGRLISQDLFWAALAILGAPLAVYGWLHRLAPFLVVRWALGRFREPGKRKAQASTALIIAGAVAFGLFYTACVAVFFHWFGWPAVFWYALSLPVASILAHYHVRNLARLAASMRMTLLWARAPRLGRGLLTRRNRLIKEIESYRPRPDAEPPAR